MAWIDGAALAHNLSEAIRLVGPKVDVLAMVKSDAYGHGGALCVGILAKAGCRLFGVATASDAAEIQPAIAAFTSSPSRVVVFGGILPDEAADIVDCGAEVVTQEIDVVRALGERSLAAGTQTAVHVEIDTGMHRFGVAPENVVEFVRQASSVAGVRLAAICSHFALAESVTGEVTAGQLETLLLADQALRAAGFELPRHIANSAAVLSRPEAHLEMVRPGIMLYGVAPDRALSGIARLRPVMRLVARVVRVADVAEGQGIGYGHTYRTTEQTTVATVRIGYADGYARSLSNAAVAKIRGQRVSLVGRVCMDQVMFDVTRVDGVRVGDEVLLWGDDPHVDEIAQLAGTISYELLARVGRRVRRLEGRANTTE